MSGALFDRFPALRGHLPWMPLAALPTPLEDLPSPPGFSGRLLVKRDDLTSARYGGNKVRKFEHVLADAKRRDVGALVTVGGIGSNQALALAIHGRALGFEVELSLGHQLVTDQVRQNVAGMLAAGARIHYADGLPGAILHARRAVLARRLGGQRAAYVPLGATSPLGTTAYIAAGLELAEQVRMGRCPPPDRIFVAAGTGGTAAGLLAGCRIAGLRASITVVPAGRGITSAPLLAWHARRALALLRRLDPSVPRLRLRRRDFDVDPRFAGSGYGVPTPEGREALAWAAPFIRLETTYTAKALAACLAGCRSSAAGGTVVFWHTYNSAPFPMTSDRAGLPPRLQSLLEQA